MIRYLTQWRCTSGCPFNRSTWKKIKHKHLSFFRTKELKLRLRAFTLIDTRSIRYFPKSAVTLVDAEFSFPSLKARKNVSGMYTSWNLNLLIKLEIPPMIAPLPALEFSDPTVINGTKKLTVIQWKRRHYKPDARRMRLGKYVICNKMSYTAVKRHHGTFNCVPSCVPTDYKCAKRKERNLKNTYGARVLGTVGNSTVALC